MCQLYLSKYLIVVRKSASRARPARRDHAHADPEGCNCKNGCEVLAELGLEAKRRAGAGRATPSTRAATATATRSEDQSVAPKPVSGGSLAREVDEQLTAADRALLTQRQLPPDAGGLFEAFMQDAVLRRQWLRWLTEHGDAYEYDATVGPTVEHVLHFQTHGFKTRQNYSSLQLDGLGNPGRGWFPVW